MHFLKSLICMVFLGLPCAVEAQPTAQDAFEFSESGQAYLKAIRWRGVDAEVTYFDPTQPPPPLDTRQATPPPPEKTRQTSSNSGASVEGARLILGLIAAGVLLAIAYAFAQYGGRFSVSFGHRDDNPQRAVDRAARTGGSASSGPGHLGDILRMADRREALVHLMLAGLIRAATDSGLHIQRSWTARDVLRNLPRDAAHLGALGDLVLAGERAHFGGRPVSEQEFQTHVSHIRPLFQDAPA